MARGDWQRQGENPLATADLGATVVTVETEFSFRYTKLAGEWVRDRIETTRGTAPASGWYVQGQQTLAPRWFVVGRVERMSTAVPGVGDRRLNGTEEVVAYRVTPDLTLRIAHRARRAFGRPGFDHQGALSAVWWKRWI